MGQRTITEDMSRYKNAFLSEAKEYISSMEKSLLKLEKGPAQPELLRAVFHGVHTLKSLSAAMDYNHMSELCHAIEDVLDAVKNKKIKPDKCVDPLFECLDTLRLSLKKITDVDEELDTGASVQKLHEIIRQKQVTRDPAHKVVLPEVPRVESIAVKVERLDLLMNLAEELLITRMTLDNIKDDVQNPKLTAAVETLGRQVSDLQYNVMQPRLVPVGFVFERFPRMVRDLAKSQQKQVDLELRGSDIELDRAVMDEIGESLVHLLRNAIDHGIETPDERRKAGKCDKGTITVTAARTKSFATIKVTDDGRGLNLEEIRNAAVKNQVVAPHANTEELIQSIFFGVSTTKSVTRVSGRGFGLNIVKTKIEFLGGAVRVESKLEEGTVFTLEIPLTLAIIKALFVKVGGQAYAIPVASIERLVTVDREDVKGMMNYEAITVNDENVPVVRLNALFDMPCLDLPGQPMVIIRKSQEKLALAVDALLTTQEIVIKPLNRLVRKNRYFSGSTITGSGEVVLILDVANLMLTKKVYGEQRGAKDSSSETG
jgi:two-component system chemotaxis sensor kinase CheA